MRFLTLFVSCLLLASASSAQKPVLNERPASYAISRMHAEHLSAMHHADTLYAFRENINTLPPEMVSEHLSGIKKTVNSVGRSFKQLPKELVATGGESVKQFKNAHQESVQAIKSLTEQYANGQPDFNVVQRQTGQLVDSLRRGESHLHASYQLWNMNPVHKRQHPGVN